jgi:hypothetical protein
MFGSTILEAAAGVIFVYLLLSLICTALNEWIASILNQRGKNLLAGIKNLLNDPTFTGLAQQVYSHGMLDGVMQGATDPDKPNRLPSYIASTNFGLALIDILTSRGASKSWKDFLQEQQKEVDEARQKSQADPSNVQLKEAAATAETSYDEAVKSADEAEKKQLAAQAAAAKITGFKDLQNINLASKALEEALAAGRELAAKYPNPLLHVENAVGLLPPGHTKESLLVLIDKTKREAAMISGQVTSAEHQIERLRGNIEAWFETTMDRVTGWYKRWQQIVSLMIACVLVAVANADTIMLARRLTRDNAFRASVVAEVDRATQINAAGPTANNPNLRALLSDSESLALPLGWIRPQRQAGPDPEAGEQVPGDLGGWVVKLIGLSISALAVSLGAPFWFDVLTRITNIRAAGIPPSRVANK